MSTVSRSSAFTLALPVSLPGVHPLAHRDDRPPALAGLLAVVPVVGGVAWLARHRLIIL